LNVNLISANMDMYRSRHKRNVDELSEAYQKEIVQHITRSLLNIQILRLVSIQPMWGYMIKKQAEEKFNVTLRHGALYPLLNSLEKQSFLTSERQPKGGRTRKVYKITPKGEQYIEAYEQVLKQQLRREDVKSSFKLNGPISS
jgi:PadR family transcriptional regulator PadR